MELSLLKIAEWIDYVNLGGRVGIVETEKHVRLNRLAHNQATDLYDLASSLGWPFHLEDGSETIVARGDINALFEPYSISIQKPASEKGKKSFVTRAGFLTWLRDEEHCPIVRIVSLHQPFDTYSTRYTTWDDEGNFACEQADADPRKYVRETASRRRVPASLGKWLLRDGSNISWDDTTARYWASYSAIMLLRALSSETEEDKVLVFRGPPVVRVTEPGELSNDIELSDFDNLQEAAKWVYLRNNDVEVRHLLFSAEIARGASSKSDARDTFARLAVPALEGAKIAYQFGVQQISRDSLKAMADLRKAVADEVAKLADSTRQLAGAVSAAVFAGIGIIAARVAVSPLTTGILTAMGILGFVLALYVASIILSGWQFVSIQRTLREQWRHRLYRFLTESEYKSMVIDPSARAERGFFFASWIGGVLCAALLFSVVSVVLW